MNRRHDSYEDYAKEIDDDAEINAHLADECDENVCPYCADERNDAAEHDYQAEQETRRYDDDVDELIEHVNKELDKK